MSKQIKLKDEDYKAVTEVMSKYDISSITGCIRLMADVCNQLGTNNSGQNGKPSNVIEDVKQFSDQENLARVNKHLGTSYSKWTPGMELYLEEIED